MTKQRKQEIRHTLFDEPFIYPHHPLMSAIQIMLIFDSAKVALARTEFGFCKAMGCPEVTGPGDSVALGISVLQHLQDKKLSVETAKVYADGLWCKLTGPGTGNYERSFKAGLEQSSRLHSIFNELVRQWDFSPADNGAEDMAIMTT